MAINSSLGLRWRTTIVSGAMLSILPLVSRVSRAQTGPAFVPGSRELFLTEWSGNGLPSNVTLRGAGTVVTKEGARMFKAAGPLLTELVIRLPENLPDAFTIELDLIPKAAGAPTDLGFEGTPEPSQSAYSAYVTWAPAGLVVSGGGDQFFQKATPPDMAEALPGNLTHVAARIDAAGIRFYLNSREIANMPGRKFVHGRVLRVALGGREDDAVYLGRVRIAATSGTLADLAMGTPTEPKTGVMPVSTSTLPVASPPNPSQVTGVQTAAPNSPGTRAGPLPSSPTNPLPVVTANTDTSISSSSTVSDAAGQKQPRSSFAVTILPTSAGPLVSWTIVPTATGYSVSRYKVDGGDCCDNNSGRTYTAVPPWQDKPLPMSGTYGYLVLANTPSGLLRAETQFSYTAPVAAVANTNTTATGMLQSNVVGGTAAANTGSVVGTTTTIGGSAATQRTVTDLTGGGADITANYRVTLTGFRVIKATHEGAVGPDGAYDEAYVSAAAILYDRKTSTVKSRAAARTREYGDVGNGTLFGNRIKAGTGTPTGGLWTGNGAGGDQVPAEFDPGGITIPPPATDRFPLLVWQGPLSVGGEVLDVVPVIWDKDVDSSPYDLWKQNWMGGSLATFYGSNFITSEISKTQLSATISDAIVGTPFILTVPDALAHFKDRPIGMIPQPPILPLSAIYPDRHVLITKEKLSALAKPGDSTTLAIGLAEADYPFMGAMYTLYLRVDRVP